MGAQVFLLYFLVSASYYLGAEGVCKTDLSDMEQLVLDKHNEYRARHQDTPPLCYAEITGDDVEFMAQEWADHVGETGKFKHTPNPKVYGENMAWSSFRGEDPDPAPFYTSGMERWYSEIRNWDFNLSKGSMTTHFTQIVWQSSTMLNCGFSTSETLRRAYVVCQYWPKGNWGRQPEYAAKVRPPLGFVREGKFAEGGGY